MPNTNRHGETEGDRPQPSEDRLRLFVESVVEYGLFMLDAKGFVTSWNEGARRMNGYLATEIVGKHFSIFYPPEAVDAGACERELEAAEREGRFEEEGWRVRKDGTRFWSNVVTTAVRDDSGDLIAFGKVTRDLTERRMAEDDLRRSEERLRLLIASVKDYAIFVLDPTGRVATWNPGAERLKGYGADEIIGQHFSRFYPESDILGGKCEMELEAAQRVGRFEDEGWRIRRDGSRFWANVVITPIRNADGVLVGFAKVTRDLSERKRHEEEKIDLARAEESRRLAELNEERSASQAAELRRARDRAEEATRLKDEFLATVSHELRTPLNAILGWSRMLQAGTLPAEKVSHAIETITRNATAQSQIIEDLLDVSRIIAGKLRLDVDLVDVNRVVEAALDVVRPAADAKRVTLHWTSEEVGCVRGDAGRLQQVLWNLLANAVKFTPSGGRVRVTLRRDESSVVVDITDTGKGISGEFLPRIFERFSQQDATQMRKQGGLGLGLAIVKHLIELHGGTVEARSAGEGRGSTFLVVLPGEPVLMGRNQAVDDESLSGALIFPTEIRGLHVLVVDDERDASELVQAVLEQGGGRVTIASSAAEAMESIRRTKPNVIVCDIGMPEEDGHEFIGRLRALARDEGGRIPAMALTAYGRIADRRRALLAGFQHHSFKPIDPQELLFVVAGLAGRFT